VVTSEDGLDEVSATAATEVVEVNGEEIREYTLHPADAGLRVTRAVEAHDPPAGVRGGTPEENAAATRAIFDGERGPRADLAIVNAGAAIYAAGASETIAEGVEAARDALEQGHARSALEGYVQASLRNAPGLQGKAELGSHTGSR
jgi:anthranilate phosphoribosyltransferase